MFFNNVYSLKIFSGVSKHIVSNIVNNCESRKYNSWDLIIIEWEESNGEWYIIKSGIVSVSIWWKRIVDLNVWDIFWEIALLNEEKRTATIKAETDLEVIILKMDNLVEILNNDTNQLNKIILKRIEENIERWE
jgi:CRP-like cAMP-binding protein